MQHLILALALFFSSLIFAQTQDNTMQFEGKTVTVTVVNALNDNGTVKFAFYNEEGFTKRNPLFAKEAIIKNGVSSVTFKNIIEGTYAIVCFHDENKNDKLDFQENGIPKESYGASNNVMNFGPPEFESSKFEVSTKDLNLEIKF